MKSKLDYVIIADFISPSVKERIMYELSSPKKRTKALERLSHNIESVIRTDYIYCKDKVINNTIKSEIKKSGSEFIVLSLEYQQGKKMLIEEAFDYLTYDCIFAVMANENWLIIKPEHEGGEGLFYVLRKKQ